MNAVSTSKLLRAEANSGVSALAEDDMPPFFEHIYAYEGNRSTKAALELLILSAVRLGELETIRPLSGAKELVFPSPFYPGKPPSDGTLNGALARVGYRGVATAHGFRTLFSTCANEAG